MLRECSNAELRCSVLTLDECSWGAFASIPMLCEGFFLGFPCIQRNRFGLNVGDMCVLKYGFLVSRAWVELLKKDPPGFGEQ